MAHTNRSSSASEAAGAVDEADHRVAQRRMKATVEGTTKKAMRRRPCPSRSRRRVATAWASPVARAISGSSAAETAMPNRLMGSW